MIEAAARAATQREPDLEPVPSSCYLCGSDQLILKFEGRGDEGLAGVEAFKCTSFGHGSHPPIWRCDACGLLFQWPLRDGSELVALYQDVEDPLYVSEKANRYHTFRRALGLLGEPRNRTLLDVGAYCGYFLDVAREGGYRPEGIELSRWASANARSLGFDVYEQTLAQRAATGATYDVVTMWDVVEHFSDPRDELRAAFDLLKPGGELYLSTIDAGSLVARAMGGRWPWLMDMHLVYFSRSTLKTLLEQAGFEVLRAQNYTHVVSADYLLRKLSASFRPTSGLFDLVRRFVPESARVPVNLGDNMVMVARRPA